MPPKRRAPTSSSLAAASAAASDDATVLSVAKQAARSQVLALAEYRGLTVAHLDVLRQQAREKGVYLHVLKNTLARRAVAGTPFEVASESMVGPLIYGFSEDAIAAAKVLADFAKGNDKLVVKGGAYAGKALNADGVKALASIPSREVLIAQVARLLKSPIQCLAVALGAVAEAKRWTSAVRSESSVDAIRLARQRGLDVKALVAASEEVLGVTEVAQMLQIAPEIVPQLVNTGKLLGLPLATGPDLYVYPRWQFHAALLTGLPNLLHVFRSFDGWAVRYFMRTPCLELGELTPLEFLGIQALAESSTPSTSLPREMIERIERVVLAARTAVEEPE
jgi:large subunit ribosomal protein L10